jgi:hypothetical protein
MRRKHEETFPEIVPTGALPASNIGFNVRAIRGRLGWLLYLNVRLISSYYRPFDVLNLCLPPHRSR